MADDSDVESPGYVKGALCKIHPQEEFSSLGSLSMGSDIYAEDQLVRECVHATYLAMKEKI